MYLATSYQSQAQTNEKKLLLFDTAYQTWICGLSGKEEKNKKVNVGSTKFQLPDDICWDNQGKQAILSKFHHFTWPAWTAQASQGETETDKALQIPRQKKKVQRQTKILSKFSAGQWTMLKLEPSIDLK